MALYTIGDLHLTFGVEKPMDVFGGRWLGYLDKIRDNLSVLTPDDTLVLCGDTSWGMTLEESLPDFQFLAKLQARILIVKGNHDYWWTTAGKLNDFWHRHGCENLSLLHNNAHGYGDIALCGTRGWFEGQEGGDKVFKRELLRLQMSLDAGLKLGARELFCFLHYPPFYEGYRCDEVIEILRSYPVSRCYFGHLHGAVCTRAKEGLYHGIEFKLVSADHVSFKLEKILDS